MAADDIDIDIVAGAAELDALEPLWIALHRHHRTVVPSTAMLVDDDSVSWSRRRALYQGWMATGDALVLVARRGGAPVGYAVAHLQDGPDDTFAVGARYAELYSLSVAPEARGGGVGTALMDTLDERLAELGISRPLDRGDGRQRGRASVLPPARFRPGRAGPLAEVMRVRLSESVGRAQPITS